MLVFRLSSGQCDLEVGTTLKALTHGAKGDWTNKIFMHENISSFYMVF